MENIPPPPPQCYNETKKPSAYRVKGPLASLREIGHVISAYIDDIFNLGMTYQECQQNIADTINLLDSLGFIIHPVELTADKKVEIKEACKSLTASKDHTIRYVAKVIGMLTASFPAVKMVNYTSET